MTNNNILPILEVYHHQLITTLESGDHIVKVWFYNGISGEYIVDNNTLRELLSKDYNNKVLP